MALGFKDNLKPIQRKNPNHHPEISTRYSNEELLQIFKSQGHFEHPIMNPTAYKLRPGNPEILLLFEEMTTVRPNVVLELIRDEIQ